MIKVYSTTGVIIGGFEVLNRRVDREINSPPVLTFKVPKDLSDNFKLENLVKSELGGYVIKEHSKSGWFYEYVCRPDFYALQGDLITRAFVTVTAQTMLNDILSGTGWTGEAPEATKRTVTINELNRYESIYQIVDGFNNEVFFDVINKKIITKKRIGLDLGQIYIHSDVNLINLDLTGDSYDVYTRIIPRGKAGIGIESINGGLPYLDNFQYMDRVKPFIWEDNRYIDKQQLKDDAEILLDEISKVRESYSVEVVNLYKQDPTQWGFLGYEVGDYLDLISPSDKVKTKQRIMSTSTFMDEKGEGDRIVIANLNRDVTREQRRTQTQLAQATETVRASLELLDDGIEARVDTFIDNVLTEKDYATNEGIAGEISTQLLPIQEVVTNTQNAIGGLEGLISGVQGNVTDLGIQSLKNLMVTFELAHASLITKVAELSQTEAITGATDANNLNYTSLVNIYTSALSNGAIDATEWANFITAINAYKLSSAELERAIMLELNQGLGMLESEINTVRQSINGDSIVNLVSNTQIWRDALSSIPTVENIGGLIDTKIIEYSTEEAQTSAGFRREVSESIAENAELISARTRYFNESVSGLEIGLSTSPFTTLINNEKMAFLEGGQIVAYIRYNQMVIENVIAKKSLQMGEHKFESYAGNLTIARWVGGFTE